MKKMVLRFLVGAVSAAALTGCVCDGTERSVREIDRKYADSAWSAVAIYTPIVGPILIGIPMMLIKDTDYYKVLLKQPETEAYEVLRHSQRWNFMYYPRSMWRY